MPDPQVDRLFAARASSSRWFTRDRVLLIAAGILLICYAALTVAVLTGSPLDAVDHHVSTLDLTHRWPWLQPWFSVYAVTGQRAPAGAAAAVYVAWRAWRMRTWQPVTMFAIALLVLNISVGAVKLATGRLGPRATELAHAVFDGGDIFPSGHASNAVVVFGVLAILVPVAHRRLAIAVAAVAAALVGVSTIVLDTHWVTDVLGGWLAGGLVLVTLPLITRPVQRVIGPYLDRFGRSVATAVEWQVTLRHLRRARRDEAVPALPARPAQPRSPRAGHLRRLAAPNRRLADGRASAVGRRHGAERPESSTR